MLPGCSGPEIAPVTLRIGVLQTQDFLPYFVMQEEGFDKRGGLRFVERSFPGGAAAINAMADGSLDLMPGVGTVPILTAAERRLVPDKIVPVSANNSADRDHPGIGLIVAHSIHDWKDLRGQKIAVNASDSIITAAVDARLQQEGVADYSFVAMPFSNMGLAVVGRNVAAAGMSEPYLTQSLLRRDGRLLDWVVGGAPFERTHVTLIVFSREFHKTNPSGVKAYLRAHLLAVQWINDNPDKARRLLAKRLKLSSDVAGKINLLRWPVDARIEAPLLDEMQRTLVKANLLRAPVAVGALYDESLLTEVLREKR